MNSEYYVISLLTDCFCAGADQNHPEIRVPSIRGHLRRWHERRGEKVPVQKMWGGIGKDGCASKVKVRLEPSITPTHKESILPHKGVARRMAIEPTTFTVSLHSRNERYLEVAKNVVETWLLLGCLGARANRAAGSVWDDNLSLSDIPAFAEKLDSLNVAGKWDIRLSKETDSPRNLRKAASDTVNGHPDILGAIKPSRKESPLKMKVVRLGDGHHLLLYAENRGVTSEAVRILGNKPIGGMEWVEL